METPDLFLISHPNTAVSRGKVQLQGTGSRAYHFSVSSGASCHHPTSKGLGCHHQQTQMNTAVSGVGVEPQCCSGKCSGKQMDITKEPPAVGLLLGSHFNKFSLPGVFQAR